MRCRLLQLTLVLAVAVAVAACGGGGGGGDLSDFFETEPNDQSPNAVPQNSRIHGTCSSNDNDLFAIGISDERHFLIVVRRVSGIGSLAAVTLPINGSFSNQRSESAPDRIELEGDFTPSNSSSGLGLGIGSNGVVGYEADVHID